MLLAGDDPGSRWYARAKVRLGAKLGVRVEVERFPAAVTTTTLLAAIRDWNRDPAVHGILVELPLPAGVDKRLVLDAIEPRKDVDGATSVNRGLLFSGAEDQALLPATPLACLELLAEVPEQPEGRRAAVVGRGDTVGRPLAALLVTRHATVTVCHTRTPNLAEVVRQADLVFAAAGRPGVVTGEMIQPGATVIDAGITEVESGIVGDVAWDSVTAVAGAATPGARRRGDRHHVADHAQRAARPRPAARYGRHRVSGPAHAEQLLELPVSAFSRAPLRHRRLPAAARWRR